MPGAPGFNGVPGLKGEFGLPGPEGGIGPQGNFSKLISNTKAFLNKIQYSIMFYYFIVISIDLKN